jgi:flagellar biosynthesis GTPase FlhF
LFINGWLLYTFLKSLRYPDHLDADFCYLSWEKIMKINTFLAVLALTSGTVSFAYAQSAATDQKTSVFSSLFSSDEKKAPDPETPPATATPAVNAPAVESKTQETEKKPAALIAPAAKTEMGTDQKEKEAAEMKQREAEQQKKQQEQQKIQEAEMQKQRAGRQKTMEHEMQLRQGAEQKIQKMRMDMEQKLEQERQKLFSEIQEQLKDEQSSGK